MAIVAQGLGEHCHGLEPFGLKFCPHATSLGVAGRSVSDDELDGDMARRGLGEELTVQRLEPAVRSVLTAAGLTDPPPDTPVREFKLVDILIGA